MTTCPPRAGPFLRPDLDTAKMPDHGPPIRMSVSAEHRAGDRPGRRPHRDDLRPHQALRLVLVIALDRDVAARCIDRSADEAESQWPSSLFGSVALAALESPLVWRRCSVLLDAAFGDLSDRCERLPAFEIVGRFGKGRHALSMLELAAMLWSLLRRSQRSLDPIIERLGVELEVAAAERAVSTF